MKVVEHLSDLESRQDVFHQFLDVVVILSFGSGPNDFLEILDLIRVRNHSSDFLQFFNAIEDMQPFKDVLLPQLMHNLEENILVRSNDGLGCLVSTIEQFLGNRDNIIN